MICDLETGVCGPAETRGGLQMFKLPGAIPKAGVPYVTDPISSHGQPSPAGVASAKPCPSTD
jgi:hypothetical protein